MCVYKRNLIMHSITQIRPQQHAYTHTTHTHTTQALARKDMAGPRAIRISLQADAILWTLCKDDAQRSPLIQASLWGLVVHTARYSDNSGAYLYL